MNNVLLQGNLARDAEIRFTKTRKPVASFTVACTTTYIPYGANEAKEITDFVPCVAWGKLAEACDELKKGTGVFVQGRYSTRSYETQSGEKRHRTEVIANFLSVAAKGKPSGFEQMGQEAPENVPF